jgi:Do/DeqQ family serine protease
MFRRLALLVLLLVCGFAAGLVVTGRMRAGEESVAAPVVAPAPPPARAPAAGPAAPAPQRGSGGAPDFADVAERTVGAVVNISAIQVVRSPMSPFMNDPFFRQFFGGDDELYSERRGQSAGSGVIVTPDGYVLTNNHVIGQNVRGITVILGDRREKPARLVATDPLTDLALLKIEGRNFPTIPWGDSSRLRVAEWVLAIGNPYQLSQTVTLGIVSALGRTNINVAGYEDFIQTDAAINPGNSGGALVNERGELVGINTAIYSQTGGYQGIGFAVPSNLARRVITELLEYGEVRRGSLGGLQTVSVTPELAQELGLRDARGALVWRMSRASAAYEAGIRPGDIIESFGDQPVQDANQFNRLLADTPIGSTVNLGLRRGTERFTVRVPVGKMPSGRRDRI